MEERLGLEYTNYDYLDALEAEYQGYDIDDDSEIVGSTRRGMLGWVDNSEEDSEIDNEDHEDEDGDGKTVGEKYADESDTESGDDYDYADEDSFNNADGTTSEGEAPGEGDEFDDWYCDENDEETNNHKKKISSESYTVDGRVFKDPRQYVFALYKKEMSQHKLLEAEEEFELSCTIRKGMLCECSIMPEDPYVPVSPYDRSAEETTDVISEDQSIPKSCSYKLVDKTSKVLRRLHQTEEEKAWVDSLMNEEKRFYISEGRAAQERMVAHNLALVVDIAGTMYYKMEFLDRIQAGNLGLLKAVQYFNPYKGNRFSTFATYLIENEIRDAARTFGLQSTRPGRDKCCIPSGSEVELLIDYMGGKYWMREVTVDTDSSEDTIRRQVASLLEVKARAECDANDIIFGFKDEFDDVLAVAEEAKTGARKISKKGNKKKEAQNGDKTEDDNHKRKKGDKDNSPLDKKRKKEMKIVIGDGKEPKPGELCTEDFVRQYFDLIMRLKNLPEEELGMFVLPNWNFYELNASFLSRYLEDPWVYTKEMSAVDLEQLILKYYLWPEWPLINWVRFQEGKGHASILQLDSQASWDDENRSHESCTDYYDSLRPTESIALVLKETNYVELRQQDIFRDAKITLEYFRWLSEILRVTCENRVDGLNREIMHDLSAGMTYKGMQEKHHISPNSVARRKKEILRCIYDQIIESSGRGNGEILKQLLMLQCRAEVVSTWKRKIIRKMVSDHYTEKCRFMLRGRGDMDQGRPLMERFHKTMRSTLQAVDALDAHKQGITALVGRVRESIDTVNHELQKNFAEGVFEKLSEAWSDGDEFDGIEEGI